MVCLYRNFVEVYKDGVFFAEYDGKIIDERETANPLLDYPGTEETDDEEETDDWKETGSYYKEPGKEDMSCPYISYAMLNYLDDLENF